MPVGPSHPDARPFIGEGRQDPRRGVPPRPDIPDEEDPRSWEGSSSSIEEDWAGPGPDVDDADEAEERGVQHLANNLALSRPCWPSAAGELVSPAEVIQFPELHPELWGHILTADTDVPVVLSAGGAVIGGMFTLCRAFVEGRQSVPVRVARVFAMHA